jgi:hypothetical protein
MNLYCFYKVVEHGLGHLPFTEKQVTTPTGNSFVINHVGIVLNIFQVKKHSIQIYFKFYE